MMRSTRGAARISAVWMIVTIVLFLVAVAFAFISQTDLSKAQDETASAEAAKQDAQDQMNEARAKVRDVSVALGFYDRETANPVSDPAGATSSLASARQTFSDLTDADTDFERALPKMVAAYKAKLATIATLQQQVQTLQGEVSAANSSGAQIASTKDQTIAQLRQQLADEQQNAQDRESDLNDRLAKANDQLSERDRELRQSLADMAQERRAFERQLSAKETRINELGRVTAFQRDPFSNYPDGEVIAVSNALNLGWIDLGANQRLVRGTRFRVESAKVQPGGARQFKAWAEVTKVEADRAEVLFSGYADAFEPPVAGDVLINPLYDPKGGRNAVLVGNFTGSFNQSELKIMLERMGIHVQPELDATTNFLIVGSALWSDPVTNEPLEEELQPSELPVYKDAEAMGGVQIIPLSNIREFFRVERGTAGM